MEQRDRMRASDSDRAMVAERLRKALDEGRLDLNEYDERVRRTYAARTYGELDGLLADLPDDGAAERWALAPTPDGAVAPASVEPGATAHWLRHTWGGYLTAVATTTGIWAVLSLLTGGWHYFWPGWVAGPWGVVLLVTTVHGLLTGEPQRWAAERAEAKRAAARRRAMWDRPSQEPQ